MPGGGDVIVDADPHVHGELHVAGSSATACCTLVEQLSALRDAFRRRSIPVRKGGESCDQAAHT
jgi:hypothetical protein